MKQSAKDRIERLSQINSAAPAGICMKAMEVEGEKSEQVPCKRDLARFAILENTLQRIAPGGRGAGAGGVARG